MTKYILFFGLLTMSSLSWSKSIVMECFSEIPPILKELSLGQTKKSLGIFKLETEEESNSNQLITIRDKGQWKTLCKSGCTKGDQSVYLENEETEVTLDFRFKTVTYREKSDSSDQTFGGQCVLME